LLLQSGRVEEAENEFAHALTIARRQQGRMWELRTAVSLTRLWRAQGKRIEARGLLAPVCDRSTEGFDTPDPGAAKALLDEL
jgi:predicted ATPase